MLASMKHRTAFAAVLMLHSSTSRAQSENPTVSDMELDYTAGPVSMTDGKHLFVYKWDTTNGAVNDKYTGSKAKANAMAACESILYDGERGRLAEVMTQMQYNPRKTTGFGRMETGARFLLGASRGGGSAGQYSWAWDSAPSFNFVKDNSAQTDAGFWADAFQQCTADCAHSDLLLFSLNVASEGLWTPVADASTVNRVVCQVITKAKLYLPSTDISPVSAGPIVNTKRFLLYQFRDDQVREDLQHDQDAQNRVCAQVTQGNEWGKVAMIQKEEEQRMMEFSLTRDRSKGFLGDSEMGTFMLGARWEQWMNGNSLQQGWLWNDGWKFSQSGVYSAPFSNPSSERGYLFYKEGETSTHWQAQLRDYPSCTHIVCELHVPLDGYVQQTAFLCDEGHYWDAPNSVCEPCAPNTYNPRAATGTCTPCGQGSQSAEASGVCTCRDPDTPLWLLHNNTCIAACNPGEHWDARTNDCRPCGPNTFSAEPGAQDECLPCVAGALSVEGSSSCACTESTEYWKSDNSCDAITCLPGHHWDTGASSCSPCEVNTFHPTGQTKECTPCTYMAESRVGSSRCTCKFNYAPAWNATENSCGQCELGEHWVEENYTCDLCTLDDVPNAAVMEADTDPTYGCWPEKCKTNFKLDLRNCTQCDGGETSDGSTCHECTWWDVANAVAFDDTKVGCHVTLCKPDFEVTDNTCSPCLPGQTSNGTKCTFTPARPAYNETACPAIENAANLTLDCVVDSCFEGFSVSNSHDACTSSSNNTNATEKKEAVILQLMVVVEKIFSGKGWWLMNRTEIKSAMEAGFKVAGLSDGLAFSILTIREYVFARRQGSGALAEIRLIGEEKTVQDNLAAITSPNNAAKLADTGFPSVQRVTANSGDGSDTDGTSDTNPKDDDSNPSNDDKPTDIPSTDNTSNSQEESGGGNNNTLWIVLGVVGVLLLLGLIIAAVAVVVPRRKRQSQPTTANHNEAKEGRLQEKTTTHGQEVLSVPTLNVDEPQAQPQREIPQESFNDII